MKNFIKKIALGITIGAFILGVGLPGVFGATYTDFVSGNNQLSQSAYDPGPGNKVMFIQGRQIDLGDSNFNSGSGVTHSDVVQVFEIPPNTIIMGLGVRVTTAAKLSGTSIEVGDGADPDGYVNIDTAAISGIDMSATNLTGASIWQHVGVTSGVTPTSGVQDNSHGAYFKGGVSPYVGADTIDFTFNVDLAQTGTGVTPVFETWVWGFHLPTY